MPVHDSLLVGDTTEFALDSEIKVLVLKKRKISEDCTRYLVVWLVSGERRKEWVSHYELLFSRVRRRISYDQ